MATPQASTGNRFIRLMRKLFWLSMFILLLLVAGYSFFNYYPYIFAKTIEGRVEKVEKMQTNVAVVQGGLDHNQNLAAELYTFAVAIKSLDGQIHTSAAKDEQWAAVAPGTCVVAKFYPYPPWNMDKAGTYFNARLISSKSCEW